MFSPLRTTLDATRFAAQDDIADVLEGDLDFKGTYYYEENHAPINPILKLKGVGRVGLPLSEPEAKRIIAHCRQAPFGQGERTVVDTSVGDTWETDAADVRPAISLIFAEALISLALGGV